MQNDPQENQGSLSSLRESIDAVDASIVQLLTQRAQLAQQVGKVKAGRAVYRPEREREVLDRVAGTAHRLHSPLSESVIRALYQEIIGACRNVESPLSVAYLGPKGTFTEMAVIKQFGAAIQSVACADIDETFRAAENGVTQFAVVPIENSTQGTITRTLDLLFATPLTIIAEVSVPIHHNLMNLSGQAADIQVVAAHPQALGQCRRWLDQHLAGVERRALASNAEAAVQSSRNPGLAAIASARAAQLYGLQPVAEGIQDDPRNTTRFLVLAGQSCEYTAQVQFKTSLVFSVPNRAGSLCHALLAFEQHGVSMMRLESRPARNGAWDYDFYVDLEGHVREPSLAASLEQLRAEAGFLKVLGSYPRAQ